MLLDCVINLVFDSHVVADGNGRWRRAAAYAEQKAAIQAELQAQRAAERASASRLGRWWIDVQIRLAVRRELNRRFPPTSLFLR